MLNVPYIVHRYVYCSCTVLAMIIAVIIDRTDHVIHNAGKHSVVFGAEMDAYKATK